jgi:hypothetical protein
MVNYSLVKAYKKIILVIYLLALQNILLFALIGSHNSFHYHTSLLFLLIVVHQH